MIAKDRDDPLTWMLLLERGRQTGDFQLAARAKRELERLGVRVTYSRQGTNRCRKKKDVSRGQ